jgi:hypothetical protein
MKKQKKEYVKRNKEHLEIKKRENKVLYGWCVVLYDEKRCKEMKRCYCYVY